MAVVGQKHACRVLRRHGESNSVTRRNCCRAALFCPVPDTVVLWPTLRLVSCRRTRPPSRQGSDTRCPAWVPQSLIPGTVPFVVPQAALSGAVSRCKRGQRGRLAISTAVTGAASILPAGRECPLPGPQQTQPPQIGAWPECAERRRVASIETLRCPHAPP